MTKYKSLNPATRKPTDSTFTSQENIVNKSVSTTSPNVHSKPSLEQRMDSLEHSTSEILRILHSKL